MRTTGGCRGPAPPGTCSATSRARPTAGWTATGDFAGTTPGPRASPVRNGEQLSTRSSDPDNGAPNTEADRLAGVHHTRTTSTFESPAGTTPSPGRGATAVNLVVDGPAVRTATGQDSEALNWVSWEPAGLRGEGNLQIVDQVTGGWGHMLADQSAVRPAVRPRSVETAVKLIVDGEVVRTTPARTARSSTGPG